MRIKRVEIIGFKSFCDRAVVSISEQITGVVGPNGCGKSNIVDAIRWCMGEQSAKHLRGKAMEDVIFAGSETRGPAPMAEVSLTFDDVGFSHETLELARHSDEAETERALDAIDTTGVEPAVDAVADAVERIEAVADGTQDAGPDATAADGAAPKAVFLDKEGNPTLSATEEVAQMLAEKPPEFDFARYTEVTITRRLYRDGTSSYFINKTPCRLRDITDFFLGTGVGTKAYAIIEQGRIGQIVSSRPQDRRMIIEEAAGITKFKVKKKAAEKKLDQTRQNLMRVSDIVTELDKRMGTLRRQAQKAERYRKYRAEMKDIELWKGSHRWLELSAEGRLVGNRLEEARLELEETRTEWTTKDAHVVAERAELSLEERRLVGVQEVVYELDNRIRLGESKIGFERREAEELEHRNAGARMEIEQIVAERTRGAEELAQRQAELDALEADVAREAAEVATREAAAGEGRQMLANAQGRLDEARTEIGTRRTQIGMAQAQLEALTRRRDEAQRRLERVLGETAQHEERMKDLDRESRRVDSALVQLRQTRLDLGSQNQGFEARRDTLTEETQRGEAEVETLRNELQRRSSRLTSLQEIQERYEGFARGTRAVMQGADDILLAGMAKGFEGEIKGVVADVVRAPETLEVAVEAALGDRLGGVLVSEPQVGLAAIGYLKSGGGGRSAFVPLAVSMRASSVARVDSSVARVDSSVAHADSSVARVDSSVAGVDTSSSHAVVAPLAAAAPVAAPASFEGEGNSSGAFTRVELDDVALEGDVVAGASDTGTANTDTGADTAELDAGETPLERDAGDTPSVVRDLGDAPLSERDTMRTPNGGGIIVEDRTQLVAAHAALIASGAPAEGVLGRMADLVDFADGYSDVGKRLLGRTVVVQDLDVALRLHDNGVTDRLVTLDGDVVDEDGVVAGGSRDAQGSGVLAQKREIRDLEEIVGRLEHDLSEAMTRLVTAKTELKQVLKALEGLRTQVHEGDLAIMGHEKDESRVRSDLDRHRDRLTQLNAEQLELEDRLQVIATDETATHERHIAAVDRIAELERVQLDLVAEVTAHRDRLDEMAQILTEARVRAAQLGEKRAAAEAATLRLARTDAELALRSERLTSEIGDAERRVLALREGCETLATELEALRVQRDGDLVLLEEGRRAYEARLSALTEIELVSRALRTQADKLAQEVNQLELRNGQITMTRNVVVQHLDERYQIDVADILHDYHQRPSVTEDQESRLTELRELIDRMGTDINLTAIEEFAEVNTRFEFLSAQKTDLERAVDQLQRAIDKINKTSRKLFKDTFAAVNATFKEVFPRLFRGGQAHLSLAGGEDVDMLEAGVEIFAQPPGKKNVTVDQLSGGEKALTAVALVFSIFLIKPSPFCILDEVDAPLDEANVDRYNELVREMTDRSQFIVITHNKRTMESADNLYGVTMQEPGVSKLVSVNLSKLSAKASNAQMTSATASA
ncbi:MAG: chromosome segregation protein SMC [Kofleriaceae bacterium]